MKQVQIATKTMLRPRKHLSPWLAPVSLLASAWIAFLTYRVISGAQHLGGQAGPTLVGVLSQLLDWVRQRSLLI